MKLRHLILFLIACFALILSDLAGGSLLALAAWLQIYNLLAQPLFNRQTQIWAFLLCLSSLPFVFFWGSVHSLLFIHAHEQQFLFGAMALCVDFFLCLIATIYFIFSFEAAASANFKVIKSISLAIGLIKTKKQTYLKVSLLLFVFSLIPFLMAEWKIVFSIMATQLYLQRHQLKRVFADL